jgi:signal transduction histidine kinase
VNGGSGSEQKNYRGINMMLPFILVILVTTVLFRSITNSPDQPTNAADTVSFTVSGLVDEERSLSIESVIDPSNESRFHRISGTPNFGYTHAAIWLKLDIKNPRREPLSLKMENMLIDSLQVFEAQQSGKKFAMTYNMGSKTPHDIRHRYFYSNLGTVTNNQESQLLIRLASNETMIVTPIAVLDRKTLIEDLDQTTLKTGLYYGIIFVMFFYNALVAVFLRDKVYTLYSLYLAAFGVSQLSIDGYFLQHITGNYGNWKTWLNAFATDLAVITCLIYTRTFLELRWRSPRLDKLFKAFIGIASIAAMGVPFTKYELALNTALLFNIAGIPLVICSAINSWRSGFIPARFYLAGSLTMFGAVFMVAFSMLGIVSASFWSDWDLGNILKFGSAFEITFFSFAMADRITLVRQQRRQAQADLLVAEIQKRELQDEAQRVATKAAKSETIARMTQMLAHDIRKPFSLLQIGLDRLDNAGSNPTEIREVTRNIRLHVGQSLESANSMLSDILDATGREINTTPRLVSFEQILRAAMTQVFGYGSANHISFTYDISKNYQLYVDTFKIQRVLFNLLENARQAMNSEGIIWMRAHEYYSGTGSPFAEITIGNSNSLIPQEYLANIFDLFFSKGKRSGTGLGLSICQKIITAHGGTIRCNSKPDYGTEFIFTLPLAADQPYQTDMHASYERSDTAKFHFTDNLPKTSEEIRAAFEATLSSKHQSA